MNALKDFVRRLFGPPRSVLPALASNNALCRDLDQTRPLTEYVYTALDTELTGLSARSGEIVSIGAVRVRGLTIEPGRRFSALVRPGIPLPKVSTLIHRITPEAIAQAPPLADVLPGFIDFCRGTLLVGHHVGLDMGFLNRACRKHLGATLNNPCLDTMRMAMLWRERGEPCPYARFNARISYTLSDLAEEYGLPRFPAHDALGDAMQTSYLFVYLAKKIARSRPLSLRELFRAGQGWTWYW